MKRFFITVLIVAFIACVLVQTLREHPIVADVNTIALSVDGAKRTYRILVPSDTPRPTPIVFAFHGIGDSPESMANYSRLDLLAEENRFILVYPAAQNAMWATINIDPSNLDENRDIRFFDQLLAVLTRIHNIDRDRVYLIGMSNGASFSQLLAVARSNVIAAIVAHSGLKPRNLANFKSSVPIMLLVGADDLVSSFIQLDADEYRSTGQMVEYICVPSLGHEWSTRHNIDMWRFFSKHSRHSEETAEHRTLSSSFALFERRSRSL